MVRILLVEDDPNQALFYADELQNEGYEVITASDGREALDFLDSGMADLVVMDISMPRMDGIEAMSRMLGKNHKLPIILNTAYSSYRDNFRSWSADAYVVKSSDPRELKDSIRRVLASRRVIPQSEARSSSE